MIHWFSASVSGGDLATWWDYIKLLLVVCIISSAIGTIRDISKKNGSSLPAPMCPNCHSFNTGKITAVKRALEHSTFGGAAPSSGNTFECYDCGYKW